MSCRRNSQCSGSFRRVPLLVARTRCQNRSRSDPLTRQVEGSLRPAMRQSWPSRVGPVEFPSRFGCPAQTQSATSQRTRTVELTEERSSQRVFVLEIVKDSRQRALNCGEDQTGRLRFLYNSNRKLRRSEVVSV